jgi:hypothetical protein
LNNETNEIKSLDLITGDILKNLSTSLKLLLRDKYLSDVSLIECNEIQFKHNTDYVCQITLHMNEKHDEGMRELQRKLAICESDKYQSIDGKYYYLPPNTLSAHKKTTFVKFDVRISILVNDLST